MHRCVNIALASVFCVLFPVFWCSKRGWGVGKPPLPLPHSAEREAPFVALEQGGQARCIQCTLLLLEQQCEPQDHEPHKRLRITRKQRQWCRYAFRARFAPFCAFVVQTRLRTSGPKRIWQGKHHERYAWARGRVDRSRCAGHTATTTSHAAAASIAMICGLLCRRGMGEA